MVRIRVVEEVLKSKKATAGFVLVLTANDWSREASDPAVWLGGRRDSSSSTAAAVAAALGADFAAAGAAVLPRVRREHARQFTVELVDALLFKRVTAAA